MVRPIEISDSLSKSEAVQRIQQNQKIQPEAVQQFQKTLTDKLAVQVTVPNPVPEEDHVVLHTDEQEKEKSKDTKDEEHGSDEHPAEDTHSRGKKGNKDSPPHDHIDIKV